MMTFSVNNCIQFGESVTRVDRLFLLLRCYILRVLHALFRQTSRAAPHYTLNQDCKNRCYCPSMPTRRQYATSWLVVITNYVMAISRKEKQYKHLPTFMVSKLYATHHNACQLRTTSTVATGASQACPDARSHRHRSSVALQLNANFVFHVSRVSWTPLSWNVLRRESSLPTCLPG